VTSMPATKYRPFPPIDLPDRSWPDQVIDHAPLWCSVDLRDGNQALVEPMDVERKRRMFDELLRIGFKQIEVGFPAASQPDFDFVRELIEKNLIPDDVTIQVLTQARDEQIRRCVESVRGARRAIIHLYNSTSTLQRRVVFGLDRAGIRDIAVRGTELIAELRDSVPETEMLLEYSPESFTGTELDFAVEICEAVMEVWKPTAAEPIILNLPSTVEMATPNIYADQIEWFGRHIRNRDAIVLSVHPHNDRGTGTAAAELALMAGAQRVEGTLFGNGERTGNVDVVNIALNLYSQGVDPELALWDIDRIIEVAEFCNRLPVHPRHPYAGELVYTSFSGSHQDAIKKGLAALAEAQDDTWEVPYLPIDPRDLGRSYQAIVRVNSQSGKGGVAYVLERDHGVRLPRHLQIEFSRTVQAMSESSGGEVTSQVIWERFVAEYLTSREPLELLSYEAVGSSGTDGEQEIDFRVCFEGDEKRMRGKGNGPIAAFVDAIDLGLELKLRVLDFSEHAIGVGADAGAVAYIEVEAADRKKLFGAGRHTNITTASLAAVVSAANRLVAARAQEA
jgi:2-isopropylmalate synthase